LHFTTDGFRPGERIAAWREVFGKLADLEFEPTASDDPFSAEARMRLIHPGVDRRSRGQSRRHGDEGERRQHND